MGISFTREQQEVIDARNTNVLVSAAAGSGKTAVLVERIVSIITDSDNPVDIDRLLIVTFTNAAAAEMRERIHNAIVKRLEQDPENGHLQKQATLVHAALITTIDSFCLFLLRNHFNEINLDPGFRVADDGEVKLLMSDVLASVLEKAFEEARPEFLNCVECFTVKGSDAGIEEYIRTLYTFSMSHPWPLEWLEECGRTYQCQDMQKMMESEWMQFGMGCIRAALWEVAHLYDMAQAIVCQPDGPYMYGELFEKEQEIVQELAETGDYQTLSEKIPGIVFDRLPSKKDESVSKDKRELAKSMRDKARKMVEKIKNDYFFVSPERTLHDLNASYPVVQELLSLTGQFIRELEQEKRERNIIDFSDMEHLALKILLEQTEEGEYQPTKTALSYQDFFAEIMVDEYQDSNLVQELLLESIARDNNRFMVGDIKQSIYKFRLARPEIFREKYETYEKEPEKGKRIDLHRNFRSRSQVIEQVNQIFSVIMTRAVGGVVYDEKAALNLGADYPETGHDYETEILLYEKKQPDAEEGMETGPETGTEDMESGPGNGSKRSSEALAIAARIRELVDHLPVQDKESKEVRPARYRDIVILLRSAADWAEEFRKVLGEQGIPVYISSRTGYFSATEVRNLLDFLRIIDNPCQDIPLAATMRSPFFRFSDEEIGWISGYGDRKEKKTLLYTNICRICEEMERDKENQDSPAGEETNQSVSDCTATNHRAIRQKLCEFRRVLEEYREKAVYLNIQRLVSLIFREFQYVEYVSALPGGEQRKANVEMFLEKAVAFERTSFHGLFHFIRYMEQLEKYAVDFGEAGILDENSDTVRIMTIHGSKGLEFPICFVAGMGKRFNMRDLSQPLLLDADMGVGMQYIDPVRRTRMNTVRRNIMAQKMKLDNLGEELRVLYVALTRAKEKLILTGGIERVEKLLQPYQILEGDQSVSYSALTEATSSLQYVAASLLALGQWDRTGVRIFHDSDLEQGIFHEEVKREILLQKLALFTEDTIPDQEMWKTIRDRFDYTYPYAYLNGLYTKTSVSELKKAAMDHEEVKEIFETEQVEAPYLPEFMRPEAGVTGTGRGNAYHKLMELLDFQGFESLWENVESQEIRQQMQNKLTKDLQSLLESGKLSKEYAEMIQKEKILEFLGTECGRRMCRAAGRGKLFREKPFVIRIPAGRLQKEFPDTETVLIQGIIDAYFEEEEGIVILDYKTDRVGTMEELLERYRVQLDYYDEALSQLTGMKVKEKIIYSFALGGEMKWQGI